MENPIKDNRIVSDHTFAMRLYSFIERTEVNDAMSYEEKEYLQSVAKELLKYQIETGPESEKWYFNNIQDQINRIFHA